MQSRVHHDVIENMSSFCVLVLVVASGTHTITRQVWEEYPRLGFLVFVQQRLQNLRLSGEVRREASCIMGILVTHRRVQFTIWGNSGGKCLSCRYALSLEELGMRKLLGNLALYPDGISTADVGLENSGSGFSTEAFLLIGTNCYNVPSSVSSKPHCC